MPPNKRKNKNSKSKKAEAYVDNDLQYEDIDAQQIIHTDHQKLQISSAQAELYFEYLRKKISHQSKDPFSLPFLNLKFEQLDQSWKGATEQLNLESRIYGMRVDNCHDNTMKLLNNVIRNQQQQIGKVVGGVDQQVRKDASLKQNQQAKTNATYFLEKPEKLCGKIQLDTTIQNKSLWKVIFKKSQTLSSIQLNTIQISDTLSLQIDQKNVKYCPKKTIKKSKSNQSRKFFEEDIFCRYPFINERLEIFKEIQSVKKEINEELEEILRKKKDAKKRRAYEEDIQNPLWDQNIGIRDLDFEQFQNEFDNLQRGHQQDYIEKEDQIFNSDFELQDHQRLFIPNNRQLQSIQIRQQDDNYEIDLDEGEDQNQENELYQPHKDFLFNSTFKKAKKVDNRKFGKVRKINRTNIDFFHGTSIIDRNKVFRHTKNRKKTFKNNNLVPINFVVVYENLNPFKKAKRLPKNTKIRANINDYPQNFGSIQVEDTFQMSQQFMSNQQSMGTQSKYLRSYAEDLAHKKNAGEFDEAQTPYRSIPMKTVKGEIMKELKNNDQSLTLMSRQLSEVHQTDDQLTYNETSMIETYLQQEAHLIGLKFLKLKMKTCDPLDILVSLLHVAYEEQVRLQPIYLPINQNDEESILHDIVIQSDNFF